MGYNSLLKTVPLPLHYDKIQCSNSSLGSEVGVSNGTSSQDFCFKKVVTPELSVVEKRNKVSK